LYIFVRSITSNQHDDEDDEEDEDFEAQTEDEDDDEDDGEDDGETTQDEDDDDEEAGPNESSGSKRRGRMSDREVEQKRRRHLDSERRSNFTMLANERYPRPNASVMDGISSPPSSQSSSASFSSSSSSSSASKQSHAGKSDADAAPADQSRRPSVDDAKRVLPPKSDETAYCWTHFSHPNDETQRKCWVRCDLCYEKNAQDPNFWIPHKHGNGTTQLWNHLKSHHFSQREIDAMKQKTRSDRCVHHSLFSFFKSTLPPTRSDFQFVSSFFSHCRGQLTMTSFAAKSASRGGTNQNAITSIPRSREDPKYQAWQAAGEQHYVSASADCLFPFSLTDNPAFRKWVEHLSGGIFHLYHKDKIKKLILERTTAVANEVHHAHEHRIMSVLICLFF
jgi:hypothetical protein